MAEYHQDVAMSIEYFYKIIRVTHARLADPKGLSELVRRTPRVA